jgi:carbon monoxide dehydrogenase subunit G
MIVEGSGKIGFLKGDGALQLTPEGEGTLVSYSGDVQVGGVMAAVGQRLLDTTSKFMVRKFFDSVTQQMASAGGGAGA